MRLTGQSLARFALFALIYLPPLGLATAIQAQQMSAVSDSPPAATSANRGTDLSLPTTVDREASQELVSAFRACGSDDACKARKAEAYLSRQMTGVFMLVLTQAASLNTMNENQANNNDPQVASILRDLRPHIYAAGSLAERAYRLFDQRLKSLPVRPKQ